MGKGMRGFVLLLAEEVIISYSWKWCILARDREFFMGIIEGHRHQAACKDERTQLFLAGLGKFGGKALE